MLLRDLYQLIVNEIAIKTFFLIVTFIIFNVPTQLLLTTRVLSYFVTNTMGSSDLKKPN